MVATRLYEVTTKGTEWAMGGSSSYETPQATSSVRDPSTFSFPSTAPRDASSSSYWRSANESMQHAASSTYSTLASIVSSLYTPTSTTERRGSLSPPASMADPDDFSTSLRTRRSPLTKQFTSGDLAMMFNNPYNSVRGRHSSQSSMAAIRSLLPLVPLQEGLSRVDCLELPATSKEDSLFSPPSLFDDETRRRLKQYVSPSETASQLAEGTIRALRDLALDEAVELHAALRYWTERWERPLLSWVEAGPQEWMSPDGYNHQLIGKKVSQIQAVLARRCAAVGELQQHLLRAGWQRGVARWGVLGQGGQWAAVAGFDGTMMDDMPESPRRRMSSDTLDHSYSQKIPSSTGDLLYDVPNPSQVPPLPAARRLTRHTTSQSEANVLVRRKAGGGIYVDDPAFLTEWSVEAIALVRRHLQRSAHGLFPLPFEDNWTDGMDTVGTARTPVWVSEQTMQRGDATASDQSTGGSSVDTRQGLVVTDLPLMVEEVAELLNVMEDVMMIQRRRRLEKLRPPSWARRNWYMIAAGLPSVSYILFKLLRRGYASDVIKVASEKISYFLRERITEPVTAIVQEIWGGRESFSDKEARMEAIESLKKMLRSWLDDTFPLMPEAKRQELSDAMDVTLLEQKKVESMKTFFEINNVIRMSFIEMQYMKKELLNALSAIDEMMSANDINVNMAAITPAIMLAYLMARVFKFMGYTLLKLAKSREETYSSFRFVLTDIERLLVMRDDPPNSSTSEATDGSLFIPNHPPVLSGDDLGMLMLLLHECRGILWQDRRRFSPQEIRSVSEDLAELAGERGAVSVRQQIQIIVRMSRTYPFLIVRSSHRPFR